MMLSICLFVCLSVCLSPDTGYTQKAVFSKKLSNLETWPLLTTNRKSYMRFRKNPFLDPYDDLER